MNKPTNTHSLDTNKERKRLLSYSIVIGMIIVAVTIFGGSRLFPFEKNSSRVESSPADYSKIVKSMEGLGEVSSVQPSQIPHLFEVVLNGTDIIYSDINGKYVVSGEVIDVESKTNLTERRIHELLAVDFDALKTDDAFTIVRGDGSRKLAIFVDPNCGFCKMYETTLKNLDNVTVHMFLIPILGPDSLAKSNAIWCSRNKAKAYHRWMLNGVPPRSAGQECDASALERNLAFAQKHRITGTPTTFFTDGGRLSGAVKLEVLEQRLGG